MKKNYKMLFEYNLGIAIATNYSYLVGQTFPIQVGKSHINVKVDEIVVEPIEGAGCNIKLVSKLKGIEFREIYFGMDLHHIDLLDYLQLQNMELDYQLFGIGFCQLVPQRNGDGIELYL